jgi:hypothetical protein
MLVVGVTIAFLLRRPAKLVVFAVHHSTLPWPLMSLHVLGQVARSFELLAAQLASMDLWFRVLLSPSHGPHGIVLINIESGPLHGCRGQVFVGNDFSSC